jgi:hypothetical protein
VAVIVTDLPSMERVRWHEHGDVLGYLSAVLVRDLEVDTAELMYTRSMTDMITAADHDPDAYRVHACRVPVPAEARCRSCRRGCGAGRPLAQLMG